MTPGHSLKALAWLVAKDLKGELRVRRAWPGMVLFGMVLVFFLELQLDLPTHEKQQVISGLLWLNVFFAGSLALERSFSSEREEGCWRTLLLYPQSPTIVYVAKMAVNLIALVLLECLLIPAFVVFSNVPLLDHPIPLILVALLGNLGFVAVGVLVTAATAGLSQRGSLLSLLQLPLLTPVILGTAEATRLLVIGNLDGQWWHWVQLLAAFAIIFVTLGILIFEFILEG